MKTFRHNKHAFTIVELVIVIAVIAILAAVLIPTFSGIINKANESKAMQEARNAWNEVSYTYAAGYDGFAADCGVLNGWYYDYIDDIAKYDIDNKYTITYDGETFTVTAFDASKSKIWDAITTTSVENNQSVIESKPFGLTLTYYDTIFSRGFSWITNGNQANSKVYVVTSNLGAEADFTSNAKIAVASSTALTGSFYSYKAFVTGLSASTTYSYKAGSEGNWVYGTFRTDSANPTTITAIQLSDAQTLDSTKLSAWENTMAQAIETAGRSLDMILYNGDQADANASSPTDYYARYGIAREAVSNYVDSLPYMASSGNHEPANSKAHVYYNTNTIDYGIDGNSTDGYSTTGAYYSYDYGFAHFVVLDSNDKSETQQTWLKNDLAASQSAKWIIVMMHAGPYATGDHLTGAGTLIQKFTPIFAEYNVDLVLQAHDHTYNKTVSYSWGASKGYVAKTKDADTIAGIINTNVSTTNNNGKTYDLNPNGTYYVTTGAAGHRVGEDGDTYVSNYQNNTPYKLICGTINVDSDYAKIGDDASANINAQMFGVLNLTETTLTYDFYTVNGNNVSLFDSLNILKTN